MNRIAAAALALLMTALLLTAAPLAAQTDPAAMTDAERQTLRAEVRAYLLENPEVLMEAIEVLEARQAEAAAQGDAALVAQHSAAIFDDGASWVGGNPQGDITLVEFMDYRCGYCRKAFAEVEDLVASDGNIRFVVKEFPILGEASEMSARFAVAVQQMHGAAAYKQVHDALMVLRGEPSPETLAGVAQDAGLDPAPVLARMASDEVTAVLAMNHRLAEQLSITGTPTFILADTMLRGYVPLEAMRDLVAQAREDG